MSRKFCLLPGAACVLALLCAPTTTSAHVPWARRISAAPTERLAQIRATAPRVSARAHRHVFPPQPLGGHRRARIIGGYGAVQSDWPFMAFIVYFDPAGHPVFNCTGTVVAPNVVLTAGHCGVDDITGAPLDPSGFAVVTGSVDWTNSAQRQLSPVSRVIVDPAWNQITDTFDASLLVLSKPTTAPAIPLATDANANLEQPRTPAYIAGWGYTSTTSLPALLQWAPTVVQGGGYCSQFDPYFDSSSELCAVNPPAYLTGTCNGDSGGPLAAYNAAHQLVEIGITTHGPADCDTYTADDFTAAIPLSSWVTGWIQAVAPPPPPPPAPAPAAPAPTAPAAPAAPAAPQQPAAPSLPTLTFPDAREDVRETVAGALGHRANPEHNYKARCSRSSASHIRCAVSFWNGPNDYYGTVTVYYVFGAFDQVRWTDSYTLHWVNDRCYYHSGHPTHCAIHSRHGTW
jgi:trypsin